MVVDRAQADYDTKAVQQSRLGLENQYPGQLANSVETLLCTTRMSPAFLREVVAGIGKGAKCGGRGCVPRVLALLHEAKSGPRDRKRIAFDGKYPAFIALGEIVDAAGTKGWEPHSQVQVRKAHPKGMLRGFKRIAERFLAGGKVDAAGVFHNASKAFCGRLPLRLGAEGGDKKPANSWAPWVRWASKDNHLQSTAPVENGHIVAEIQNPASAVFKTQKPLDKEESPVPNLKRRSRSKSLRTMNVPQ